MGALQVSIRQGNVGDLNELVPLFDRYRQFYRQPSDPEGARRFLLNRLEHNQSIVFLAFEGGRAIGFTQLYPSFSSGAMARIFILNDLFVAPEARQHGVGTALLNAAAAFGRQVGALRLVLSTEAGNTIAQSLYQKLGWQRDTAFFAYQLRL